MEVWKSKAGLLWSIKKKKTIQASFIKSHQILPWQLGHIGTIHGVYSDLI